jgi:hypothetical protein
MTWSIVLRERDSGRIAIAVATKFFAVGARVPYIEPQKGAVATQALLNPLYGIDGLKLIRDGIGRQDVVRMLTARDEGRDHRQVHVLGADGRFAAHTGAACVPWCGHWVGDDFSVAGNMWPARRWSARPCACCASARPRTAAPPDHALKAGEKVGRRQARQAVGRAGDLRRRRVFGARPARRRPCRAAARARAASRRRAANAGRFSALPGDARRSGRRVSIARGSSRGGSRRPRAKAAE